MFGDAHRIPALNSTFAIVFCTNIHFRFRIRWKLELLQTVFAGAMFLMAVFTAKPVFMTSIHHQQEQPLTFADLMMTLAKDTQLGYAPDTEPYKSIMERVGTKLNKSVMSGMTESDLNDKLYQKSRGTPLKHHVIWVIWKPKEGNVWKFSIRCTELAESSRTDSALSHNMHLRVGFLAVQMAVSEGLVEDAVVTPPRHRIKLVAMPMSPLMREEKVRDAMTWILLCFTLAFIPPVMEISALVVTETTNRYKRALRIRDVGYSCMYIGWLSYAYLTVLPICMLAGVALILIFRWIFLFFILLFVLAYISVMIMMSLIVGMFQNNG
ncbi:hypothetical protein MSG28_010708 [Choristoneura fumiferana]|uniref:Uncharacterized protein n=1 Tax=Choristoneura fumiferana TaxID=7141 RepID=A0ACC0KNG1_CHOFU|nr:hypothetical protein MSG28_010708 [Choristoneura fumiferana]